MLEVLAVGDDPIQQNSNCVEVARTICIHELILDKLAPLNLQRDQIRIGTFLYFLHRQLVFRRI